MTSGVAYIKSPCEFVFGDDVELFLARFQAFAVATKCEAGNRFDLFKSFLDDRSFRRVQAITFEDEHKTSGAIDLAKDATKALLKTALMKEPQVPERIALKFKVQGSDEEIEDFGDAVRLLGQKVHGQAGAESNQQVIEAFCAGLRDPALASKLLSKKFENLTAAINFALARKGTTNIKNVISRQRARSESGATGALPNTGTEADISWALADRSLGRSVSPARPVTEDRNSVPNLQQQGQVPRDNRTCYRCHRVGHIERFCDQAAPALSRPRGAEQIICYQCGLPGHIRRNCRASVPRGGTGQGQLVCYRCGIPGHTSRNCNRSAQRNGQNFRGRPGNRGASGNAWPAR